MHSLTQIFVVVVKVTLKWTENTLDHSQDSLCVYWMLLFIICLQEYYEKGFPKTDLQLFVEQCNDPLHSGLYKRQHTENHGTDFSFIEWLSSCCRRWVYVGNIFHHLSAFLVGWVVCQLVDWSVSWLIGLSVGWLVCQPVEGKTKVRPAPGKPRDPWSSWKIFRMKIVLYYSVKETCFETCHPCSI